MTRELTASELADILREIARHSNDWLFATQRQLNEWLARGDGIAVYRNEDLSSHNAGERKMVSFGSPVAMLETETPPTTLPDTPSEINWRYQLFGTYRGEAIDAVSGRVIGRDLRETSRRGDLVDVVDVEWFTALDNHEPGPRATAHGFGQYYSHSHVTRALVLWDVESLRDAARSVYLVDDGDAVTAYYNSGSDGEAKAIYLHPFPTTERFCHECGVEFTDREEGCDSCFTRKQRNGFRPFTFETWQLGPRRAYHLKVRRLVEE